MALLQITCKVVPLCWIHLNGKMSNSQKGWSLFESLDRYPIAFIHNYAAFIRPSKLPYCTFEYNSACAQDGVLPDPSHRHIHKLLYYKNV